MVDVKQNITQNTNGLRTFLAKRKVKRRVAKSAKAIGGKTYNVLATSKITGDTRSAGLFAATSAADAVKQARYYFRSTTGLKNFRAILENPAKGAAVINPKMTVTQAKQILRSKLSQHQPMKGRARSRLAEAGYTSKGIYDLESGYVSKVNGESEDDYYRRTGFWHPAKAKRETQKRNSTATANPKRALPKTKVVCTKCGKTIYLPLKNITEKLTKLGWSHKMHKVMCPKCADEVYNKRNSTATANPNVAAIFNEAKQGANNVQTWGVPRSTLISVYKNFITAYHNHATMRNLTDVISYGKALGYSDARIKTDLKRTVKRNSTASDFKKHQSTKLQELAKLFQGVANGEKTKVLESDYTPKDKYRLGHLVQIKIKDQGKTIPIDFDGEAYLAADLKNNLWVTGKDSIITNVKRPAIGQLKYLGEVVQVDYVTAKRHIENNKTVRFYHKMGEVTGEKPNLFLDHDGFILFIGGGFDIWDVGIVN